MLLKRQLMRLMVVGGLAVMGTGMASAGGGCWCGGPAPKPASQPMTAQLGVFYPVVSSLLALI